MQRRIKFGIGCLASLLTLSVASQSFAHRHVNANGSWLVPGPNGIKLINFCDNPLWPCPGLEFAVLLANPNQGEVVFLTGNVNVSEMAIDKRVVIVASANNPTPPRLIAQGGRHFKVGPNGDLTLTGLELINGSADWGGSILTAGTVQLNDTVLKLNTANQGGGGIYASSTAEVSLFESVIWQNVAVDGGGIYADGAVVSIEHSTLSQHEISGDGGGLYARKNATVELLPDAIVEDNVADRGAGLFATESNLNLDGALVTNNNAESQGGGVHVENGALLTALESSIEHNRAEAGSGLNAGNRGGGINVDPGASVQLAMSTVDQNHAYDGGGLYATGSHAVTIEQSSLTGNTAWWRGGAVSVGGGTSWIVNSTFDANAADWGGAIRTDDAMSIEFCTLVANTAANGPAISSNSPASVSNTIIEASVDPGGNPSFACQGPLSTGMDNRIGADTLGYDATCGSDPSGDFNLGQVTNFATVPTLAPEGHHYYEIGDISNARDGATNCAQDVDQRGAARDDGACDVGSFEYTGS